MGIAAVLGGSNLRAADSPQPIEVTATARSSPVSFTADILPVLRNNCLACHKASGDPEGGLVLETPAAMLRGGDDGPAIVPGKSADSRLLQLASHQREPLMPPTENKVAATALTPEQLGLIKLWIDQGAHDDSSATRAAVVRQPLPAALAPIYALAITPDDELVACNRGERLFVYDVRGPRLTAELIDPAISSGGAAPRAHEDLIRGLAFDRQGDRLASAGFRTVKIWRRPRTAFDREMSSPAPAGAMVVSPDGRWLALGLGDGTIELHDLSGKAEKRTLGKQEGAVTALAFSPDAGRLFAIAAGRTLAAIDVQNGSGVGKIRLPAQSRALCIVGRGKQLATGDDDNVVRLWDVESLAKSAGDAKPFAPTHELKGHTKPITALAADGNVADRLVSGSEDGRVRLWNTSNGESAPDLDFGPAVASVAIRGDGRRIAAVGANGLLRIWNPTDGALVADIKENWARTRALARAESAAHYAAACVEYRKEELREAEEQLKREQTALEEANKGKAAAEKAVTEKTEPAKKAIAAREQAEAKAREAATTLKAATKDRAAAQAASEQAAKTHADAIKAAEKAEQAAANDSSKADLAAARQAAAKSLADADAAKKSADAALQKTTAALREAEQTNDQARQSAARAGEQARDPERNLQEAKNTLQGAINFIVTAEDVVKRATDAVPVAKSAVAAAEALVKVRQGDQKKLADGAADRPALRAVAFSPDNELLAVVGHSGSLSLYDAQSGAALEELQGDHGPLSALAFGADDRLFGNAGDKLIVWKVARPGAWKLEQTIGRADDPGQLADRVLGIDFSPDGKLLAAVGGLPSRSGELKLWDAGSGQLVREIPAPHRDAIYGVRFSPDGQYLASVSADRLLKVFRVADGSLVRTFEGHAQHVVAVAWSADGKLLATAGSERVVKLWDFATGTALRTMPGDTYQIGEYRREITSVNFIGDTEHLIASAGDGTVRLHRTSSARDVRTFKEGGCFMHAALATSDGRLVVGGGQDGVLHFWNGENGYEHRWFTAAHPDQRLDAK